MSVRLFLTATANANLAAVFVETTVTKVREQASVPNSNPPLQPVSDRIRTLMTKNDVAAYLQVSKRTVDSLILRKAVELGVAFFDTAEV